ncbi:ABC transporter ATP-binding protein [Kroppenstedtia pulmonis]|uniref:ABC transporter ATP-binding protein n=1 Tax=Kroppenstedtia pulmonis TaxID=1380685 RepID=A0A7D4CCN0_9BACL|nr:ABC transporter ATP-binding protein [Kroppenstedtia pulmonis]QKG83014.1 ABC transporter ATP-binding protein [Kroppenstedtia pulmonis]
MTQTPIISVENVEKSYHPFQLHPLDFEVQPGFVYGLVGPNGSGKSTLFRMLMNLVHPEQGQIRLFGQSYDQSEVEIKQRIGYVPENTPEHGRIRVRDLIQFVSGWYPQWNQQKCARLLKDLEIDDKKYYHQLSKGMKKKISFIMTLSSEPDLLLLDEPTDGLDLFAQRIFRDELNEFLQAKEERSVLLATHRVDDIQRMADILLLLNRGHFQGTHEKDMLLDTWKCLWLNQAPAQPETLPGVVNWTAGPPHQLITNSLEVTQDTLNRQGIAVQQTTSLELSQILEFLLRHQPDKQ